MTRAAVLLSSTVGFALVARAAAVYRGSDPIAFSLVLLIGLGLLLGTLELLARARLAARLASELAALPRPATSESIARSSAPLRGMLETRIAGGSAPAAPASFTSYLVGLLVMIGLLGTFLGLFETLQGAREALTASGDVDALRSGLAAPMQGLSRAFGTSAAGVSASATLGLGAVIVRRAEARFGAALVSYAAGPLASLTAAGRQLAALEALARQGEALPAAIEALLARLAQLEDRLTAAQRDAAREGAAAFAKASAEVRGDIEAGVRRAAEATAEVVEPLAARVVERAGAIAGESLARIERRTEAASEAAARLVEASAERLAARAEADAARDARLDALLARLDDAARQIAESASAQAERVEALSKEAAARAAAQAERADVRLAALSEAAQAALAGQAARLAAFEERLEGARGDSAGLLAERLAAHARGVGESLAATAGVVREGADLVRAGGAEMSAVAEMFAGAVDRYREASDRWLESLGAIEDAIAQKDRGEAEGLLGAYLDQTREVFDHSLQFQRELFSELRALRSRIS